MSTLTVGESSLNTRADGRLRLAALAFTLVGVGVSGYLTYLKLFNAVSICSGIGDCEAVNTSRWSQVGGVPVALLGLLAYLAIAALLALESRVGFLREWGPAAVFAVALAGTLYSGYLTYIEVAVIHKICPFCVASAVAMTAVTVIAAARLRRYL